MKIYLLSMMLIISVASKSQQLNGVTIAVGAGYSRANSILYDYSLSPDAAHNLEMQSLSRGSFVISSVLIVKLGKLSVGSDNKLKKLTTNTNAKWYERLAVNLGINLVEVNSDNIAFNKNIDGGIGLGYFINDYVELGGFFDVFRVRQLRDYIAQNFQNKPIPNGTGNYNALDVNDNNLFYNKTVSGFSFKIIVSINNKKGS